MSEASSQSRNLKRTVSIQAAAAALLVILGIAFRSPIGWWSAVLLIWVGFLIHSRNLFASDPSVYPRLFDFWPALFARVRNDEDRAARRWFPDVALEAATAPFLGAGLYFVIKWIAWSSGVRTDMHTDLPLSQPHLPGSIPLFIGGYYWWTVHQRFTLLRPTVVASLPSERDGGSIPNSE